MIEIFKIKPTKNGEVGILRCFDCYFKYHNFKCVSSLDFYHRIIDLPNIEGLYINLDEFQNKIYEFVRKGE